MKLLCQRLPISLCVSLSDFSFGIVALFLLSLLLLLFFRIRRKQFDLMVHNAQSTFRCSIIVLSLFGAQQQQQHHHRRHHEVATVNMKSLKVLHVVVSFEEV